MDALRAMRGAWPCPTYRFARRGLLYEWYYFPVVPRPVARYTGRPTGNKKPLL